MYTETLDPRFGEMEESFRDKMLESMKWEDSTLRRYIEKNRLEEWYRTVVDAAEKRCRDELDILTQNGARTNGDQADEVNGNGRESMFIANGKLDSTL